MIRQTRPRNLIGLFDKGVDCDRQGLRNLIDHVDLTDRSKNVLTRKTWKTTLTQSSERCQTCLTINFEIVMIKLNFYFVIVSLHQVMFIQIFLKHKISCHEPMPQIADDASLIFLKKMPQFRGLLIKTRCYAPVWIFALHDVNVCTML